MKKLLLISLLLYPLLVFAQDFKDCDFILFAGGKNVQKYNTTTGKWSRPLADGTFLRFGDIIKAKDRFTLKTKSPWWDFLDWFSKEITLDDTKEKRIVLNKSIFDKRIKESCPVTTNVTHLGKNKLIDLFVASCEKETIKPFNLESELIRVDKTKNMSTILNNDTISLSETECVALTVVNKDSISINIHILWQDSVWDSFFPRNTFQSYKIKPYSNFNAKFELDSQLGKRMILILPSNESELITDKDFFNLIDSLNNKVFPHHYLDNVRYPIHNFNLVK